MVVPRPNLSRAGGLMGSASSECHSEHLRLHSKSSGYPDAQKHDDHTNCEQNSTFEPAGRSIAGFCALRHEDGVVRHCYWRPTRLVDCVCKLGLQIWALCSSVSQGCCSNAGVHRQWQYKLETAAVLGQLYCSLPVWDTESEKSQCSSTHRWQPCTECMLLRGSHARQL